MPEDKQQVAEKEVVAEQTPADAPKKNAVAAEPMKSLGSAEDLGPAVVKPTDSNPDATKKMKKVSDQVNAKAQDADASNKPDTEAGVPKFHILVKALKWKKLQKTEKSLKKAKCRMLL